MLMRHGSFRDPNDSDDEGTHEFRSGFLVVREKTIIIGNSVYSVRNISSVTISDLSYTKPFPRWVLVCAALGCMLVSAASGSSGVTGTVLLLVAILGFAYYVKTRSIPQFVLSIRMNAGTTAGIVSGSVDFLKQIATVVYDAIDYDVPRNVTFNLDERIAIDNISGSVVSVGASQGDLVNQVSERHTYA